MRDDCYCTTATVLPQVELPEPQVVPVRDLAIDDFGERLVAHLESDEAVSVAFSLEGPRDELELLVEELSVGVSTRVSEERTDVDVAAIVTEVASNSGADPSVPESLESQIDAAGLRAVDDVASDALVVVLAELGEALRAGYLKASDVYGVDLAGSVLQVLQGGGTRDPEPGTVSITIDVVARDGVAGAVDFLVALDPTISYGKLVSYYPTAASRVDVKCTSGTVRAESTTVTKGQQRQVVWSGPMSVSGRYSPSSYYLVYVNGRLVAG